MMSASIHKKSSTIRLPQRLLEQVKDSRSSSQRYHTSHFESPNPKKARIEYVSPGDDEQKTRKPTNRPKSLQQLKEKVSMSGKEARSEFEVDEDAYIAYLESKLGLKKSKKTSSFDDDGLEDLLSFTDSIVRPLQVCCYSQSSQHDSVWSGISQDHANNGVIEPVPTQKISSSPTEIEKPASEQTTGRYVAPHLRKFDHDDNDSETIQKLTRHLKGLLNRMSEQNIASIISSVEGLYRDHCRHDVTSTLTTLIINSISNHSSLLDSFVVIYAAFVSSLHNIIGIDFAAHFVQHTVASYDQCHATMQVPGSSPLPGIPSQDIEAQKGGKECANILVLLSELYNFQVISSVLVFDIIRALLDGDLTEFNVEMLLKLLRNSGQQLRQDDPSALKDIINIVQGKVAVLNRAVSSRTTFMIETLTNLKNNKLKRNLTQNQGGAAVERMKKFLSNLKKTHHVLAHEPLRVSLEDLHSANSQGKWWLVGAGWGGDPLIDKQADLSRMAAASRETDTAQDESDKLAKLARAQGMNTEIRRGVFIVLMSSDDYIDACERLSQLNLSEIQQREIVRVLLHCCGNEKPYNPYYTLLCQQLCRISHAHKITVQYCLWDFLRDLGETNVGGAGVIKGIQDNNDAGFDLQSITQSRLDNVAKAYGWWIAKDSVSLLVLKPVDFTVLKPRTREFLRELMIQIFVNSQISTPLVIQKARNLSFSRNRNAIEEIFIKASRIQALAMGLVYFLSETFKSDVGSNDDGYSKFIRWAVGRAKATLQTGIDVVTSL